MKNTHSTYALNLIKELTLEEKILLVQGHNFMYTNEIKRLNIPSIRMSDGPHGLRVQDENGDNGISKSLPSTSFPTAATTSNSFNPNLLYKMGSLMAEEAKYYGINIVLGPGVNIKRNPLCGRNFEYFSEDPILASRLGLAEVNGLQDNHVGVSVKHFAFNNEENYRFMGSSYVDMRVAREIYLRQFEYIVKNGSPDTLMCAYNQLNDTFCSENKWLLKDLLRDEWKYNGLVMSDWGAVNDRVKGVKSGLDLEMPGDTLICRKWLYDAVNNKELKIEELDECVLNVLDLVNKHKDDERLKEIDFKKHHEIAKDIAVESAVLLKNDGLLPLNKNKKLCIVGELFEKMRYQGAGSSMINPALLTTPKEVFDKNNINYVYFKGYKENELITDKKLLDEMMNGIKEYDEVLLFAGLTDYVESEGCDRPSMSLSQNQLDVINELIQNNKKIILVLFGGSVIELPFYEKVNSILNMFLPGQNGGLATYELLYGIENPSGKLAETWPMKYEDVLFHDEFAKKEMDIYKESIYVGYRYYLTKNKEVRFPFGYGLSYTTYEYNNLKVKEEKDKLIVSLNVKNTGLYDGKEIVEVYVKAPKSSIFKPLRELKGFTKVSLKNGEEKEIEIEILKEDLKYYDIKENRFVLEDGEYEIEVGKNSKDIILTKTINLIGEKIEHQYKKEVLDVYQGLKFELLTKEIFEEMSMLKLKELPNIKPITLETRFSNLSKTFIGRILHGIIISVMKKDLKKAKKMPLGPERDNRIKGAIFMIAILESNSLRSLSMSAGKQFTYHMALAFKELSNGHILRGLGYMLKKIKLPKGLRK